MIVRECHAHSLTEHVVDKRGHYRCRQCRSEAVVRRRAAVRDLLLAEAGGACALCGYDRHYAALEFHHVDPKTKLFNIRDGMTRSVARMRFEAAKCVLLCRNCHAEVETGFATLPATIQPASGDRTRGSDVPG